MSSGEKLSENKKVAKVKPNLRASLDTPFGEEARNKSPVLSPTLFESGINTECIQLTRQLWNLHEEASEFTARLTILNTRPNIVAKTGGNNTPRVELTPLKEAEESYDYTLTLLGLNRKSDVLDWTSLRPLSQSLQTISQNVSEVERQFNLLSAFQSQCKLVLFAKVLQARKHVAHDHIAMLYSVQELIYKIIKLSSIQLPPTYEHLLPIFQLSEMFNSSLEQAIGKGANVNSPKVGILKQVNSVVQNDSSSFLMSLKPLNALKLITVFLSGRILPTALSFLSLLSPPLKNRGETGKRWELTISEFGVVGESEGNYASGLLDSLSSTPSLLGRGAVKKNENNGTRLRRTIRGKMLSFYEGNLWKGVGELAEDFLLWDTKQFVPLVLLPFSAIISLRETLSLQRQLPSPLKNCPILSAFECVATSLHSFSLLTTWDTKIRSCLVITSKIKRAEEAGTPSSAPHSDWATLAGAEFGHALTSVLSLLDEGGWERKRESIEEEPLADEAQVLFRLDATVGYFKSWVVRRSLLWLNSWAIPQFLALSQRDSRLLTQLIKSRESILITREILLKSESTSVRLSARYRQICADDLRESLSLLQSMPDELLNTVGPICKTLSLATLQSCMPPASHWRGFGPISGLDPDRPSSYVHVFIGRVIEPVISASVEYVNPRVQEGIGKQVIHAGCEAWLQYILNKKIKFSEWGAVQLLRDFMSLRDWIRNETELSEEARRGILQLEVLKRCEGVAYLLLRSPGDVLGVGKTSRRASRRVSSSAHTSRDSSPSSVSDASVAEDDIPPEMYVSNQQMWLELRLRRNTLSSCCQ